MSNTCHLSYKAVAMCAYLVYGVSWSMPANLGHWPSQTMIRQICNIRPENVATVRSKHLIPKFEIKDLDLFSGKRRLCLFGHVEP